MENSASILPAAWSWGLLLALALLWMALGFFFGRKAKDLDGFMLAGRNVGLAFGSATAVATWITSNTTLLAPQFALQMGVWGMIAYCTASVGLFLFAPLARRIQTLMPEGMTSGDFIRLRYGEGVWKVFLLISAFYAVTWLVSMGMAGGLLMETLAGIPYKIGMTVILFTCITYTLVGGMYAVIGTDFLQTLIILFGILVVAFFVFQQTDMPTVYQSVQENRPALLNVLFPAAIMAVFNNLLFGLGEIFHSNVWWSRAFAIRKGLGAKAYTFAGLFWLPIPIVAGFIALAADSLGIMPYRPDIIGPLVAGSVLGQAGSIIIFIVVFCSIASSIDSLLAATSDLMVKDFIGGIVFKGTLSREKMARWGKACILIVGVGAWLLCLPRISDLASVLFFAGPLVGSTIWPIITGLYWRHATKDGAMLGMLCGSVVGLWAYFAIGWFAASLVGTAVSMLVVLGFARLRPAAFDFATLNERPFKQGAAL